MTRSQFKATLAKYPGVTWDTEMERAEVIQIDSPSGKRFAGNQCHTIVERFENPVGQSWKSEAYSDVVATLSYGLEDCEIEDCDVCNPESISN